MIALLALTVLAGTLPAPRQKPVHASAPPTSHVAFERDAARGFDRARDERRPIFLAFLAEGAADVAVQVRTLRDPGFAARSRALVCIVADPETHDSYDLVDESGPKPRKRLACHRYRWIECSDHQRAHELAAKRYPKLAAARPSLTFLSPDGADTIARWGPSASARRLADECLLALRASGRHEDPNFDADTKLLRTLQKRLRGGKRFNRREALRRLARIPLVEARTFLFALLDPKTAARTRILVFDAHGMRGSVDAREAIEGGIHRELDGRKNASVLEAGIAALGRVELGASVPYLLGLEPRIGRRLPLSTFANALALCGRADPRAHAWFAKAYAAGDLAVARAAFNATAALDPSRRLLAALREQLDSSVEERRTAASRLLAALEQRR